MDKYEAETPVRLDHRAMEAMTAELVSRLLITHRVTTGSGKSEGAQTLTAADLESFVHHVLHGGAEPANLFLDRLIARGIAAPDILLGLLGRAVSRFGEMWESDTITFTDVTIGLCTMHQLLRERDWRGDGEPVFYADGPSILFTNLSGEQHVFGIMIVAEVFRNAGWRVMALPGAAPKEVLAALAQRHFDVLGLSSACGHTLESAAGEIRACREASKNVDLKVVVGGQGFDQFGDVVETLGVDAYLSDAETAPAIVAGLHGGAKIRT